MDATTSYNPATPSAAPAPAPERGALLGRYVVLEPLGTGGMGVVLSAFDVELERRVAIKLMRDPAGGARLWREAQALAKLSHPNVVTVYEVGVVDDRVYLAMEQVDGSTLRAWGEARRGWREILDAYLQAGAGLAAAHRAGLVHRDVKPDNILIGDDGRVRIGDFGLVAAVTAGATSGGFAGTMAYAAPEQLRGDAVDARGDQFSFCVALWEALGGARPFGGETPAELAAAIAAGPRGARMPAWIRAILERGLAADPARRHPSIDDLLAALARDPARRRRRVAIAAVGVAGIAGAAALAWSSPVERAGPACEVRPAELAGVWDADAKARIAAAFRATGRPNADAAFAMFARTGDRYAERWLAQRADACAATHERGTQSEALLDLRMRCLDRRRTELAALSELLSTTPDKRAIDGAPDAVLKLSSLDDCANAEALAAPVPPPRDYATLGSIRAVETRLDRGRALTATGRAREWVAHTRGLVVEARRLAHAPLLAHALLDLGLGQLDSGELVPAEATLREAARVSATAKDDRRVVLSLLPLAFSVGRLQRRVEAGLEIASGIAVAIARVGDEPLFRLRLLALETELLSVDGKLAAAVAKAREAEALLPAAGPSLEAAMALHALGNVSLDLGRSAEARVLLERSIAILRTLISPDHPAIAARLNSLGIAARQEQDFAAARRFYGEALAIKRAALGDAHPSTINTTQNLGNVALEEGQLDEARAQFRAGVAGRTAAFGPSHPAVAQSLASLGSAEALAGDFVEARAHLAQALALQERATPGHPDIAETLISLALVARHAGTLDAARASLARALEVAVAASPDHPMARQVLLAQGELEVVARRPADAKAAFLRAQALLAGARSAGSQRERIQRGLAAVAVATGDPGAARLLLETARAAPGLARRDPLLLAELDVALARLDPARAAALRDEARALVRGRQELAVRELHLDL
jgi:eukaryotic-like serine/threonine-protein kinase